MKLKTLALTSLTLLALAACGKQAETSVPADSAQSSASAPAAPAPLTEGVNYTVLSTPIPQQQAGKVEVLEFFGYFCPHCAHLEPVLSEHTKNVQRRYLSASRACDLGRRNETFGTFGRRSGNGRRIR